MKKNRNDISIFKVENNILSFNKEEAREFPAFKEIIIRDKGSEGDSQGRKKIQAFKELFYIYLVYNPSSMFRELPDKARKLAAKNHVGLEDSWEEDEAIKNAIKEYIKALDYSSLYYSYVNANRSIYGVGEDLNFYNNRRNKIREDIVAAEKELSDIPRDPEFKEQRQIIEEEVDKLLFKLERAGESILNISNKLPKAFEEIKKLGEQLALEEGSGSEIRGGGKLGNREA